MGHYDYELSAEERARNDQHREYLMQSERDKIHNHPDYTEDEKRTLLLIMRAKHDGLLTIRRY